MDVRIAEVGSVGLVEIAGHALVGGRGILHGGDKGGVEFRIRPVLEVDHGRVVGAAELVAVAAGGVLHVAAGEQGHECLAQRRLGVVEDRGVEGQSGILDQVEGLRRGHDAEACGSEAPVGRAVFGEESGGRMLHLDPAGEHGFEPDLHGRVAAVNIPRTVRAVEVGQRQLHLLDARIVRHVVGHAAVDLDVEEAARIRDAVAGERCLDDRVRDLGEVPEVVGHFVVGIAEVEFVRGELRLGRVVGQRRNRGPLRDSSGSGREQGQDYEKTSSHPPGRAGACGKLGSGGHGGKVRHRPACCVGQPPTHSVR